MSRRPDRLSVGSRDQAFQRGDRDTSFRVSASSRAILTDAARNPNPGASYASKSHLQSIANSSTDCTFTPAVNNMSVLIDRIVHGSEGTSCLHRVRLMEEQSRTKAQRIKALREDLEEQERSECSFHPKLNPLPPELQMSIRGNLTDRQSRQEMLARRQQDSTGPTREELEERDCVFQPDLSMSKGQHKMVRELSERYQREREEMIMEEEEDRRARRLPSRMYRLIPAIGLQPSWIGEDEYQQEAQDPSQQTDPYEYSEGEYSYSYYTDDEEGEGLSAAPVKMPHTELPDYMDELMNDEDFEEQAELTPPPQPEPVVAPPPQVSVPPQAPEPVQVLVQVPAPVQRVATPPRSKQPITFDDLDSDSPVKPRAPVSVQPRSFDSAVALGVRYKTSSALADVDALLDFQTKAR